MAPFSAEASVLTYPAVLKVMKLRGTRATYILLQSSEHDSSVKWKLWTPSALQAGFSSSSEKEGPTGR